MPSQTRGAGRSDVSSTAHGTPARGTVLTRTIPGGSSGFRSRPAMIYLPPVLRADPRRQLPVIELLHGTPGATTNWLDLGHAAATLDAFAAAHGGLAPIVVMPDINGTLHGDTECVRSPGGGDVERYLTTDVRGYVLSHFPASRDPRRWSVAGLSEGGTCAIMLALRHTGSYSAFGDLSGLAGPTVKDRGVPSLTIKLLFSGSRQAYEQHEPLSLMRLHAYPSLGGWFECGAQDKATHAAQGLLSAAARRAGITVHATTIPGRHSWKVWGPAFRQMLPWLWARTSG
ncbi:MAG: alpha/beta hydrolase [Jatrophihabitans sp.]